MEGARGRSELEEAAHLHRACSFSWPPLLAMNSQWAELLGGIIATSSAVHLASDSWAFVDQAQRMLAEPECWPP